MWAMDKKTVQSWIIVDYNDNYLIMIWFPIGLQTTLIDFNPSMGK